MARPAGFREERATTVFGDSGSLGDSKLGEIKCAAGAVLRPSVDASPCPDGTGGDKHVVIRYAARGTGQNRR
jgi:hypothetical protein